MGRYTEAEELLLRALEMDRAIGEQSAEASIADCTHRRINIGLSLLAHSALRTRSACAGMTQGSYHSELRLRACRRRWGCIRWRRCCADTSRRATASLAGTGAKHPSPSPWIHTPTSRPGFRKRTRTRSKFLAQRPHRPVPCRSDLPMPASRTKR